MKDSNYIILGFLYENPTYPYSLAKAISDKKGLGLIWNINLENLYQDFNYLESKKLIKFTEQKQEKRPDKKIYQLTTKGKKSFEDWLFLPVEHGRDIRVQFFVKYFFIDKWKPEMLKNWIEMQIARLEQNLKRNEMYKDQDLGIIACMVLDYRKNQTLSIISWLKGLIDKEEKYEK